MSIHMSNAQPSAPKLNRAQQARWDNARRIGERLMDMMSKGFLIVDEDGAPVKGEVVFQGFSGWPGLSIREGGCSHVYFHTDPETANGMELTIKQFNNRFARWRAYPPTAAVSLLGS